MSNDDMPPISWLYGEPAWKIDISSNDGMPIISFDVIDDEDTIGFLALRVTFDTEFSNVIYKYVHDFSIDEDGTMAFYHLVLPTAEKVSDFKIDDSFEIDFSEWDGDAKTNPHGFIEYVKSKSEVECREEAISNGSYISWTGRGRYTYNLRTKSNKDILPVKFKGKPSAAIMSLDKHKKR